ncbi:MAG: hypothetical protein ACTSVZ_11720 [Promethearchaeota archaeon]
MVKEENIKEKKQISYGKLISKEDFASDRCIPSEVKDKLENVPYYLFIFIPADEILKISVFPSKNPVIKKILIRLKEFSPELVKGISEILKNFKLGNSTIHTTGLCFENINCFYETYMSVVDMPASMEEIKAEFLKVRRVEEVSIIDIPVEKW